MAKSRVFWFAAPAVIVLHVHVRVANGRTVHGELRMLLQMGTSAAMAMRIANGIANACEDRPHASATAESAVLLAKLDPAGDAAPEVQRTRERVARGEDGRG